ncbi:MAG: type II secretion system protein GspC [Cellvibrionaceae bacterium]
MAKGQRLQSGLVSPLLLAKGVVALLLVLWMAVSLSSVFWKLLPQPDIQEADISANAAAFSNTKKSALPPVDIDALKNIKLFGDEVQPVPVAQVAAEPVKEDVEETRLNLELVGSFANEDQKRAYAIIANGKKQELYRVDQEVAGLNNVKLRRVFAEKVILDNRGRQEALFMYPEGKPITSSRSVVSPELSNPASAESSSSQTLAGLNSNQRLEKISDAIRFSRKTKDGKMVGFRVLPGRNRAAFEQTGLKLNDIVTAIDGQTLDNLKSANKIYQEKRNATQASLTVLRGEEELTVDVDLNNINVN